MIVAPIDLQCQNFLSSGEHTVFSNGRMTHDGEKPACWICGCRLDGYENETMVSEGRENVTALGSRRN